MIKFIHHKQTDTRRLYKADAIFWVYKNERERMNQAVTISFFSEVLNRFFPCVGKTFPKHFFIVPRVGKISPRAFLTFPQEGKAPPRPFLTFPQVRKVPPRAFCPFPQAGKAPPRPFCCFPLNLTEQKS